MKIVWNFHDIADDDYRFSNWSTSYFWRWRDRIRFSRLVKEWHILRESFDIKGEARELRIDTTPDDHKQVFSVRIKHNRLMILFFFIKILPERDPVNICLKISGKCWIDAERRLDRQLIFWKSSVNIIEEFDYSGEFYQNILIWFTCICFSRFRFSERPDKKNTMSKENGTWWEEKTVWRGRHRLCWLLSSRFLSG